MATASDARERIEVVFGRLASVDLAAASFADCERALADAVRIERWTSAVKAKAAVERDRRRRAGDPSTTEPESTATSESMDEPEPQPQPVPSGRSSKEDTRAMAVRRTIELLPSFGDALADGQLTEEHLLVSANAMANGTTDAAGGSLRTAVVVFIDDDDLVRGLGHGVTVDGQPIDVHEVRRLAAEAHIIPAVLGRDGQVLDMGRAQRFGDDAQWLMLIAEQGGCWNADCVAPVGTLDAHHCREWADGGPTDLGNLAAGCTTDHRRVHANGDRVHKVNGHVHIIHPDGTVTVSPNRRDRTPIKPKAPPLERTPNPGDGVSDQR